MHLLTKLLSVNSLLARHEPANIDVGHWDLTLSGGSSSSGYVWHDVYSIYSGTPNVTVHCTYTRGPTTSATGDTVCDEMIADVVTSNMTTFRYQWNGASGLQSELDIDPRLSFLLFFFLSRKQGLTRRFPDMTLSQTVEIVINGVKTRVNLTGTAPVNFGCGLGFNRLACEGTGRVNATTASP